jgi:hypothetical protein
MGATARVLLTDDGVDVVDVIVVVDVIGVVDIIGVVDVIGVVDGDTRIKAATRTIIIELSAMNRAKENSKVALSPFGRGWD